MYSEKRICHFKLGIPKTQDRHHYHNHYCQHLCHHEGKIAKNHIYDRQWRKVLEDGSIIEDVDHMWKHCGLWKHWTVTLTFEISQIKSFQKLSTAGGEGTIFVLKDLGRKSSSRREYPTCCCFLGIIALRKAAFSIYLLIKYCNFSNNKKVQKFGWSFRNKSCVKLPPTTSCGPGQGRRLLIEDEDGNLINTGDFD